MFIKLKTNHSESNDPIRYLYLGDVVVITLVRFDIVSFVETENSVKKIIFKFENSNVGLNFNIFLNKVIVSLVNREKMVHK